MCVLDEWIHVGWMDSSEMSEFMWRLMQRKIGSIKTRPAHFPNTLIAFLCRRFTFCALPITSLQ